MNKTKKVWKDLNDAEYRRHLYMRERSYASEPGSRIALKDMAAYSLDERDELVAGVDHVADDVADNNRVDADDDDDTIECDVGVRTSTLSEPVDFGRRSQTLLDTQTPPPVQAVVSVQQAKKKQKTKKLSC